MLFVWPNPRTASFFKFIGGEEDLCEDALSDLESSTSISPTQNERDLVDLALSIGDHDSGRIVTDAALRWKDPQLWNKAVAVCKTTTDVDVLGHEYLIEAYTTFGFNAVFKVFV